MSLEVAISKETKEELKNKILKYTNEMGYDSDGDIVYYFGNHYYVHAQKGIIKQIAGEGL